MADSRTNQAWPPRYRETTLDRPLPVPYLERKPGKADIRTGRQLLTDDYLIESTTLERRFHRPEVREEPILTPETPLEMNGGFCPCACPFGDGICYDEREGIFRLWYHAGWFDGIGYAESRDGIHFTRVAESGSGLLERVPGRMRDGASVWLDRNAAEEDERFKMMVFFRTLDPSVRYYHQLPRHRHDDPATKAPPERLALFASPDGIHWQERKNATLAGDNSSFYYDPFRKKWVFSLRTFSALDSRVRTRGYVEAEDFFAGSSWRAEDVRFWSRTDLLDRPDPELGYYTQLYSLNAVAYESLMLGMMGVFTGPPNDVAEKQGLPKRIELKTVFSRDGFHWQRGSYEPFIAGSGQAGTWNYGYAHAANGLCTVVGDQLYFYVSFFSGRSPAFGSHLYAGGSTALAVLRRDGFASLETDGTGEMQTVPLQYAGKCLFVNADCPKGLLQAEVQTAEGQPVAQYTLADCDPVRCDGTAVHVTWQGKDLPDFPGQAEIRLRFRLVAGALYAFWIADDSRGKSRGFLGAGSPGSINGMDL